ncbi:MAG TPA: efflux RND transporter periplasmic adaptor subunit [Verrucomicrobiota bacterium]|nr:efflux RND transporter periplasmic adaptor subunit [Verrucomicrobiales bacterium]HRI12199.1 efflux RND transporter periplasmic adaptor subunit [Verrucomicrobiota bacterium]
MNNDSLERLRIAAEQKRRPRGPLWLLFGGIVVIVGIIAFFAVPRSSDSIRTGMKSSRELVMKAAGTNLATRPTVMGDAGKTSADPANGDNPGEFVLRTSGYIIARERIEVSPRFMGLVKWIGIKKGDVVTNGQVVVILDDAEYRARQAEIDGQIAVATVAVEKAKLDLKRAEELVRLRVEMEKSLDDAKLGLASAEAQVRQLEGSRQVIQTWLDWCVIKSPVNGVVLEKLAEANELVTPQNFGGTRGPSTSLLAVADLNDLQVEIDVNEQELAKISLGQRCRVRPEAFLDRIYEGVVAEIAPEASRQKGTLQVKVQIKNPDRYLTPELSAKVDFYPIAFGEK